MVGKDTKQFKMGIVGCGTIAGTHAEAVSKTVNGKLVAAHSRTNKNLNVFCNHYGVKGYLNYKEFLSQPELDIVVVCTPSGTHLDFGKAAAKAGKHVIVEKPIEITLNRGKHLISGCRSNGVKLAVIYQNRFIDGAVQMKRAIDDGELGNIFMVDASVKWFRDQEYYDQADWRGSFSLDGGGAVINQAIHTIDLLLWFCGDIKNLHAFKGTFTHTQIEGEDNAVASIEFESGAIGVFRASTSIVPAMNRKIAVHGTKGTALLDGDTFRLMVDKHDLTENGTNDQGSGSTSPLEGMSENHHKRQYDEILDAFTKNIDPVISGEESLRSLAVVEAIYKSTESKVPISLVS